MPFQIPKAKSLHLVPLLPCLLQLRKGEQPVRGDRNQIRRGVLCRGNRHGAEEPEPRLSLPCPHLILACLTLPCLAWPCLHRCCPAGKNCSYGQKEKNATNAMSQITRSPVCRPGLP